MMNGNGNRVKAKAGLKGGLMLMQLAGLAGFGLLMNSAALAQAEAAKDGSPVPPVVAKEAEKPPHVVEKTDMKGELESPWLPHKVHEKVTEEDLLIANKTFFSKMNTYPDIRFREFFDPRYLKKHGLEERDIAFEVIGPQPGYRGIHNIIVADDLQTVLCLIDFNGGGREAFVLRWVVYEGHLYVSPEKGPDPGSGIFTPWILRTKVN